MTTTLNELMVTEDSEIKLAETGTNIAVEAAAAQTKAMVEARYVMALRRPRNWEDVRQKLLKECRRPGFAKNKSTLYNKPIGKGVEGLGIRFVEVAIRCMTNVMVEVNSVYEDAQKEVLRVTMTDLEANTTFPLDIRVAKTIERSRPMDDGSYISVRKNSYGKNTYTIPGTDDELLNKRGAQISKAIRSLGIKIIPGDLQDEAEEIIRKIRLDSAAKDPNSERNLIIDGFSGLGVTASALNDYLGHLVSTCTPLEIVKLRGLYGAIRDGETTWAEVLDNAELQGSSKDVDRAGEIYDQAKHATDGDGKPIKTKDGYFRKRRTTAKKTEEAKPDLDDSSIPTVKVDTSAIDIGKTDLAGNALNAIKNATNLDELAYAETVVKRAPESELLDEELAKKNKELIAKGEL